VTWQQHGNERSNVVAQCMRNARHVHLKACRMHVKYMGTARHAYGEGNACHERGKRHAKRHGNYVVNARYKPCKRVAKRRQATGMRNAWHKHGHSSQGEAMETSMAKAGRRHGKCTANEAKAWNWHGQRVATPWQTLQKMDGKCMRKASQWRGMDACHAHLCSFTVLCVVRSNKSRACLGPTSVRWTISAGRGYLRQLLLAPAPETRR
jgi:hypothetical protein